MENQELKDEMTDSLCEDIEDVYVLLNENYRISRNIRMVWFFNNILKDVNTLTQIHSPGRDDSENENKEIQVLSWCGKSDVTKNQLDGEKKLVIQPSTRVHFLSRGFRFVFALDLSPSAFQVSIQSHSIVAENILSNLADCLCSIVKPVCVPYCESVMSPDIYVTVFAQTLQIEHGDRRYKQDVIVQSCLLTPKSIAVILAKVEKKIFHDISANKHGFLDQSPAKSDNGLVSMLKAGLLSLQLLPSNTSAGLVVITDCITGFPDMAVLETLVNHLRSSSISCSVIHVAPSCFRTSYAYCPNVELFKFIALATYGTYMEGPLSINGDAPLNAYQKALLFWKFQAMDTSFGKDVRSWHADVDLRYTPDQKNMLTAPLLRKKHFERILRVSMYSVLTVRLREGYMITSVCLKKNNSQLEVELVYPWNHCASLKYIASSSWPNPRNQTKVEVYIDGTYEFLSDMLMGVSRKNCSRYKDIVFKRFSQFVKGLSQTDHMLAHLMSFSSESENLRPMQNRLPLFYLPPNSNQLVLSMQNETGSSKAPFVAYWKPILSLDIGIWQKWLHTHHIDLVLRHDMPLPKHLHTPSKHGRYHSIQCSSAMSQVTSVLREWCTFILLENHTFIKFINNTNEEKPSAFYIIRLSNKHPVLIIRLAFLIGTPGAFRNKILAELREKILSITLTSPTKPSHNALSRQLSGRTRHFSSQMNQRPIRSLERPCVTLTHKPLDRILIRYEHSPKNFMHPPVPSPRFSRNLTSAHRAQSSLGGVIAPPSMCLDPCKYLSSQRNVWSVTNHSQTPLSLPVVSQIATLLVKLKLSEGYHFASTYSGVVAMIKEFPVKSGKSDRSTQYCTSQYIIFPPTAYAAHDSSRLVGSGLEEDDDGSDCDRELFLATESWIEPQFGHITDEKLRKAMQKLDKPIGNFLSTASVDNNPSSSNMFQSVKHKDISRIISMRDLCLLKVVVTLEHLRLMCVPGSTMLATFPQSHEKAERTYEETAPSCGNSSYGCHHSIEKDEPSIKMHPCLFDLIALLERCPRMKLQFMTLSQDPTLPYDDSANPNIHLFDLFHSHLKKLSHCEAQLSEADCVKITKHMMMREICSFSSTANETEIKWKCFLKVLPKATVMITLVPASIKDLSMFAQFFKDLESSGSEEQKDVSSKIKPADDDSSRKTENTLENIETINRKFSRRKSLKMMNALSPDKSEPTVNEEHLQSLVLPVFVYECVTSSVTESLLKDPTHLPSDLNLSDLDVEQDHRIKLLDDEAEVETPRPKFFRSLSFPLKRSQRSNSSDDTKSHDDTISPNSTPSTSETPSKIYNETLVDIYHRCFVRAVLLALRKNEGKGVASADVQAATDAICIESVHEIDITQFLLITCPQVAIFKNNVVYDALDKAETDDVFTSGGFLLPVSQREAIARHGSSTSSNADNDQLKSSLQIVRTSSDSGDQTTRGNRDQISRFKYKNKIDDAKKDTKLETEDSGRVSAFKKPRRRPQSLPKACEPEKQVSDTDGDTPDIEERPFRPVPVDNSQKDVTFGLESGIQGKSVTVGTPMKKLMVLSKVDWSELPDFPINLLKEIHPRHISGTDDQVQVNFLELLSENFHPVHSAPEIHYLRDEQRQLSESDNDDADSISGHRTVDAEKSDDKSPSEAFKVATSDTEMSSLNESHDALPSFRREMEVLDHEESGFFRGVSNFKRSFSDSSSGSLTSMLNEDDGNFEDHGDATLFLCMTCTVRDKKTGNHGTALVHKLPTKLGVILSYLEDECEEIGLGNLSITLDLIWMVLPPEVEVEDDSSFSENSFASGLLPDDDDSPRHDSSLSKQRSHFLQDDQEMMDPLSSVSKHTRNIIRTTRSEIDWLLKDETISAIRACEHIDSQILKEVTQHIEKSSKDNCVVEEEALKFVFGPGRSLKPFTELFETKFYQYERYQLRGMDQFYYLVMQRTFLPIQNWPAQHFTESHFTTKDLEPYTENQGAPVNFVRNMRRGKTSQESKEVTPERISLKKTKSSNDSSLSPPVTVVRAIKSCASLPHPAPEFLRSSVSFNSLPGKGDPVMSVDEIESDVVSNRQSTSTQSTPNRKISSAFNPVNAPVSSAGNLEESPDMYANLKKYSRGLHPRRSLPVTPTLSIVQPLDACNKTDKRRRPVAQRSFDNNPNISEKFTLRQHSNTVARLSPLCVGSTPPLIGKASLNISTGSASHVPLSRRRSANSATPVSQVGHSEAIQSGTEPNSSTPMVKSDGTAPPEQIAAAFSNSAYILNAATSKEAMSSPVSLSDGELHRYSTASCFESGYDGEVSDMDDDDCFMRSLDERIDLPSFWLIIEIKDDKVKIYFHRRNSSTASGVISEQKKVYCAIREYIIEACKCVNQKLLLLELHDTRACNPLLVEETEEDIWNDDQYTTFGLHDDHADDLDRALLADAMTTAPGQFQCDCVLERIIPVHPRLKMTVGMAGKSTVIALVRQLMTNLMVMNRKNMFVYQLNDKSVCYCRMSEDPAPGSTKSDSRRSSQLLPNASDTSYSEPVDRRMSKESLGGELKSTGSLILRWHGIGPLTSQQEDELEKMNESVVRRFNESVMEKMTVVLQRNSKLSPQDVLFIQPTISSDVSTVNVGGSNYSRQVLPNVSLSYSLPEEFTCCISAVKYYLHQNLLQFTALPRYVDTSHPATHFVAYKMKGGEDYARKYVQHEGSVYLFHQAREPGKTGYAIACIVLEISDIEGNATPTYSQMKFQPLDPKNYHEIINLTDVSGYQEVVFVPQVSRSGTPAMVEQMPYHPPPQTTGNYIRFHLWLKGSLTVEDLHNRLRNAVRHALCDAITELFVLRPPLSGLEIPGKRKDDVLTPMEQSKSKRVQARFTRKLSLPSHGLAAFSKRWSDGDHSSTYCGSASPDGGRTEAMRSLFGSLNDPSSTLGRGIFTNLINPKLEQTNKEEDVKGAGSRMSTLVRRQSVGAQSGDDVEEDTLNEVYQKFAQEWFSSMHVMKCASIFQEEFKLSSRSHLKDFVLNLQKIITGALADCKVKIFSADSHGGNPTLVNLEAKKFDQAEEVPSRYVSYIILVRNFPLWRKAIGQSSYTETTSYGSSGKFRPYDALARPDQSPRPQEHRFTTSSSYISRQQFVMISIHNGEMKVWGYNIANEISTSLIGKLKSCKDFHEARWRARDCLTFQKLGLFRHCPYGTGYPTRDNQQKGTNPYTRDVRDVDMVLTRPEMPNDGDRKFQQQRSKSSRRPFFKETYFHHLPIKPLSSSTYESKDTTVQYAEQYLELKAHVKKNIEEQQVLQRVFTNCRDRSVGAAHNVLTMDTLQTLLRYARTIHHVGSPILMSPYFRRLMPRLKSAKPEPATDATSKEIVVTKRQKRLSGSIRKSGDFSSKNTEETRSRSNSTRKDGRGSKNSLQLNIRDSLENPRYDVNELKKAIANQYTQYWQSLQFLVVREELRNRSEKSAKKLVDHKNTRQNYVKKSDDSPRTKPDDVKSDETGYPIYLYRASGGGIVIMEVGFVGMNFSLKLHVIEATKLQNQPSVKQQMNIHFLNECEQLKDLTHVHSFMYDFHLRYMQMYIQERQTAIRPGYHVVSFLQDFTRLCGNIPDCAVNSLHHGKMTANCSHVSADELYEYLVGKQTTNLGFKTLKLVQDSEEKSQHAMVSSHFVFDKMHSVSCNMEEHEAYDIGYVIWLDRKGQEEKKIQLKYFLLFTNRRHVFPRLDRLDELSQNMFPLRRSSANLTPRAVKVKPSEHVAQVQRERKISAEIKTTESIAPLRSESPTRKIMPSDSKSSVINSSDSVVSPFQDPAVKRSLQSQGRRKSMPNFVAMLSEKKPVSQKNVLVQQWKTESDSKHCMPGESEPQSFVQCEKARLSEYLEKICASAEIQCYKNLLWHTVYTDKPLQNHPSALKIEEFEHLLKHCQMIPLSSLDKRGNVLCNIETMGIQWAITLQKRMRIRFDQICRYFVNAGETKRCLGILNPKLSLMMFLLTVDTEEKKVGMFVVVRDKITELETEDPDLSPNGNPNIVTLRGHLNNMLEFVCFHTWSSLFS